MGLRMELRMGLITLFALALPLNNRPLVQRRLFDPADDSANTLIFMTHNLIAFFKNSTDG